MPIEGFNFQEFSKNLAQQASTVVPREISEDDKKYIVNIVYNFCNMAGEALYNDAVNKFDANQASIITQFIGEWAFHKAVDTIKGNIAPQFREGLLQKVAFTVFEIAKQSIINRLPQDQMINLVEHHVKKVYKEALDELKSKGALTEQELERATKQSNIDEMSQTKAPEPQQKAPVQMSGNKILKLAAFSMILKNMPQDKILSILNQFDPQEAQAIIQYIKTPDLEQKIDKNIVMKCLQDIKMNIPTSKKVNMGRVLNKLFKIVKNSDKKDISTIINEERSTVKGLVQSVYDGTTDQFGSKISPHIAQVVCEHIEEKIR